MIEAPGILPARAHMLVPFRHADARCRWPLILWRCLKGSHVTARRGSLGFATVDIPGRPANEYRRAVGGTMVERRRWQQWLWPALRAVIGLTLAFALVRYTLTSTGTDLWELLRGASVPLAVRCYRPSSRVPDSRPNTTRVVGQAASVAVSPGATASQSCYGTGMPARAVDLGETPHDATEQHGRTGADLG